MAVQRIIKLLKLQQHPEGGFYAETFRDTSVALPLSVLPPDYKVDRPVSTAIYFLVPTGSVSRLHRMPASEVWHFYDGDPLTIVEINDEGIVKLTVLGRDIEQGQVPQYVVPPKVWFGSFPTEDLVNVSIEDGLLVKAPARDQDHNYSLVGCTVAPGFQFEDFELAKRANLLAHFPHAKGLVEYLTADD